MAKMPYDIKDGKISVRIEDTDLFHDIIGLLESVALTNDTVLPRLAEIMPKHDTRYEYSICEECQPDNNPLCTQECQAACPMGLDSGQMEGEEE